MTAHRPTVVVAFVALLGVLAASPQRTTDAGDSVAREVRDLRLSLERASALSTQVTLVALQASATQARIASVSVELANIRAQGGMLAAQAGRQRQLVADFERDFPDPSNDPTTMMRDPRSQEYQRAKASLSMSQPEDWFRPRESELASIVNREQAQLNELMVKLDTLERSLKVVQ